jgi:predicted HTH domain antitoxin
LEKCEFFKKVDGDASMETLSLQIPDEISEKLQPYKDKLHELILLGLQQLKIQEALLMYSRGVVSFGRAAELAGLSEKEMIRQARTLDIEPHWSEEMVQEELA